MEKKDNIKLKDNVFVIIMTTLFTHCLHYEKTHYYY